jgi:SAM-dependent methyltransferase
MTQLIVHNPKPKKPYAPRRENDFYPTPKGLIRAVLGQIPPPIKYDNILDPGAGTGVWGKVLKEAWPYQYRLTGIDINLEHERPEKYDAWHYGDFLTWETSERFHLIVGNPPYSLGEKFVHKALSLLQPGGEIVFLLTLEFLGSQGRYGRLWSSYPPHTVHILPRRPSFTGDRKTDGREYAIYRWRRSMPIYTELLWLNWEYDDDE